MILKRNNWILIGIVIAIIIAGFGVWWYVSSKGNSSSINSFQACIDAGYLVQDSFPERCVTPDGKGFTRPTPETKITIEGNVVCLPHHNTEGPQTLECAIGLKTEEETYYALRTEASASELLNSAGSDRTVRVFGVVKYEPSDKYQISGTLTVDNFEFIE